MTKLHRVLFLSFFVVFCLFLSIFFALLFSAQTKTVGRAGGAITVCTAVVRTEKGEITCSGYCDGNTFLTVCHLFTSEQLNERAKEQVNGFTFFHMNECSVVLPDNRQLVPLLICAHPVWDTAVFLLPETFSSVPSRDTIDRQGTLFFDASERVFRAFDDAGTVRYLFPFVSQKGQSGYPLTDKTGSVNAIICAFDEKSHLTIATPSFYWKSTREALFFYARKTAKNRD